MEVAFLCIAIVGAIVGLSIAGSLAAIATRLEELALIERERYAQDAELRQRIEG